MVEFLDQILPNEDPEGVRVLVRAFRKSEIKIYASAKVLSAEPGGDGVNVQIEKKGKTGSR